MTASNQKLTFVQNVVEENGGFMNRKFENF